MALLPRSRRGLLLASVAAALSGPVVAQSGFEVQAWPAQRVAPTLAGLDSTGKPLLLSDLRGQALVINFWATWCEPCRDEMPSLAQLSQSQAGKVRVLTVNYKESSATVAQFVAATGLSTSVLRDPDGALARAWGIRVFPSTVLVGADGTVLGIVRGALDWHGAAAARLIAPLMPGVGASAGPRPGPAAQR
ncbi:MAG: TlpA disulfide reductase family protein [Rhodoferax sp.]|nr:TlpA disulfide reductase family protein [Rhodoferax sp.]